MSPVSSKTVTGERSGPGGPPSTPPPPAYCSSRGSGPWNMICRLAGLIGTQGQADWTRPKYERTIRTVMGGGTWMLFLLLLLLLLFCFILVFFCVKKTLVWFFWPVAEYFLGLLGVHLIFPVVFWCLRQGVLIVELWTVDFWHAWAVNKFPTQQ